MTRRIAGMPGNQDAPSSSATISGDPAISYNPKAVWRSLLFASALAMAISLVWAGLGQIYRGELVSGIVWMILTPLGYLCFIIPGLILHLLCIIFAGKAGVFLTIY